MKLIATFFVPGVPCPQGSKTMMPGPRTHTTEKGPVWKIRGHWHRVVLMEGKGDGATRFKAWRAKVERTARMVWAGREPLTRLWVGPVFIFPRLKSHLNKSGELRASAPTEKNTNPDTDKLQRCIGDALEAAGVCRNDSQIVGWKNPHKRYGAQPGAQISIYVPETETETP